MGLHRYTLRTFGRELLLLTGAALFCLPLYLVVVVSLKTSEELRTNPLGPPLAPTLDAFTVAWTEAGSGGLGGALLASLVITVGSVGIVIAVGSLGAYVLGRRDGRVSSTLYVLFLLGFIVPIQLAILPLYTVFSSVGLLGSLFGMVILQAGLMMPLGIILYTGFVRVLPRNYEDAAHLDGAGDLRTFWYIIFPLLRPVTATVAVLGTMFVWNDFFSALIFLGGSDHETVPVAVYSFVGEFSSDWPTIFAAVVVSLLPVLLFYVVAQRQLMQGLGGGLKG